MRCTWTPSRATAGVLCPWSSTWCPVEWIAGAQAGRRMPGCSRRRVVGRCVSRTGSARLAGVLRRRRLGCGGSGAVDLRHTAASVWLGAGRRSRWCGRVLGHAAGINRRAMDLSGHLVDADLWEANPAIGDTWGHLRRPRTARRGRDAKVSEKVPGKSQLLRGGAYRNRTDDLRITRGTLPSRTRPSCTDSTGHCTDDTRRAGIIRQPGPQPVHGLRLKPDPMRSAT